MLTFYYIPHKAVQWWPHSAGCSHLLMQSLLLCESPNIQPRWTTALARGWREMHPHNVPTGVAVKSHRTNADIREATFVQTVQLRRQSKAFLSGNYIYSWNPWKYRILRKFWKHSHLHLDMCKSLLRQNSYTNWIFFLCFLLFFLFSFFLSFQKRRVQNHQTKTKLFFRQSDLWKYGL